MPSLSPPWNCCNSKRPAARASSYLPVLLILLLTAVGTSVVFHTIERKWVTFRHAEQRAAAGDYEAAADLYGRAVQQGLDTAQGYRGWGAALVRLQRFEEAREPLERAVRADPSDAGAVQELAGSYQHLQQPEQALRVLEAYQARGYRLSADALLQKARIHRQLKEYAKAEPLYRAVPASHREAAVARRELAEMLAWQRRYDEAIGLLNGVLAENPADVESREQLAQILGWAGKLDEAREQYRRVLRE